MYRSSYIVNPCRSDERRLQHTEGEEENGPDDEVHANAGHESASFCFDGCGDDHRMADHVQPVHRTADRSNYHYSRSPLLSGSTDKPPYFAVGFKSEKANHKYRFVWLYKVRAKPVTENYATKEGKSITRQTGEVEWTAIRRTHDNQYQAVADEGENGFTAEKGATFLESVYEPVFTSSP